MQSLNLLQLLDMLRAEITVIGLFAFAEGLLIVTMFREYSGVRPLCRRPPLERFVRFYLALFLLLDLAAVIGLAVFWRRFTSG